MFSDQRITELAAELQLARQTRPVAAPAGDTFQADDGPLGSIAFRFT